MKASGASGAAVVSALVAASATFESKTAFSQEKYMAKKKRKHCARVTAHAPCAQRVCSALLARAPARIAQLRWDSLALSLNACDAQARASVLVADAAGGLAAAAVLERMGGLGRLVVTHPHASPQVLDLLRNFNFDQAAMAPLRRAPLLAIEAAFAPEPQPAAAAPEAAAPPPPAAAAAQAAPPSAEAGEQAGAGAGEAPPAARASRAASSARIRVASDSELRAVAAAGGFSSLFCVEPAFCARAMLERLLPLLSGGAPFAVFSHAQQPLAEAAEWAIRERWAVCVELHEPWSREYQVLPSRTHPHMGMSATGGYLLIGTRVLPAG